MQVRVPFFELKITIDELSKFDDHTIFKMIGNDTQTQFLLGVYFEKGCRTFSKDNKRAVFWHKKAAEQGHMQAQYELGLLYMKGVGVGKNEKMACYWFEKAAEQGDIYAQYCLGFNYYSGKGVEKDENKCFYWINKAANKGNPSAQVKLGNYYEQGIGVSKDLRKAAEYYMKAAKQGKVIGQCQLGFYFLNGTGVDKDVSQAAYWFKEAAKQGFAAAQYRLGKLYMTGQGVERDERIAVYWYEQAASQADADAQWALGMSYFKGRGVEKNEETAAVWFKKAAENGHRSAKHWVDKNLSCSADFLVEQAKLSNDCYVPCEFPQPVSQIGPYCGVAAFVGAVNYNGCLPYPLYATEYEKMAAGQSVEVKDDIVLHQLKYNIKMKDKWRTQNGEIFNVKLFKKLAKHYGIEGCEAVIRNDGTERNYGEMLRDALKNDYTLIVACDTVGSMPVKNQGKTPHWVWSVSYNADSFGMTHHDLYAKWLLSSLFKSNQMPEKNPHKEGGDLLKFRGTFFKVPVNRTRMVICNGIYMESKDKAKDKAHDKACK